MTDSRYHKVVHRNTTEIAGTACKAESELLYTGGQFIQGEYHVCAGNRLRKRLQRNESRSVSGVGHITDFQFSIVLANHVGVVVEREFAGVEFSIEERKCKYLGFVCATACVQMLFTGSDHIALPIILFLRHNSHGRSCRGNNPAVRSDVTYCFAAGSIACEGFNPRHVLACTSGLEGRFYGLAHLGCRAIGANVQIIFLLIIETGYGY